MTPAELDAILVTGMARKAADYLVEQTTSQPELIRWLFQAAQAEKEPRNRKAAYVIRHVGEKYPGRISAYIEDLDQTLGATIHNSIRRDILKCYLVLDDAGALDEQADRCMGWLTMSGLDAAVKYYSAMILERVCERWPDLEGEFALVLESQLGLVTDNFDRYATRVLKRLKDDA